MTDISVPELIMELIKNRRSIRRFTSAPVDYDSVMILLEAAMYAPSGHNNRPWHFIACDDPVLISALHKIHPYSVALETATLCIAVVCAKPPKDTIDLTQQDGAAATQNLILSASALGLGTCWMGVAPRADLMELIGELLELPDSMYTFGLVAVGYPAEERPMPGRFTSEKIHVNRW